MTQPAPNVADPYRTLGVTRSATDAEIKAAHRKLAKRFHPDAGGSDTRRFLRVQEAYRVLSDPLLRREWDARHAPGPIRADRGERPARTARQRATPPKPAAGPTESPPPPRDPRREPRTSRAYTWSAGEVPWWEEGVQRDARRRARQSGQPPSTGPASEQPQPGDAPNEFDVYNRSSGAAWSMAARAYFRRGDQELPRRGSFHHQGSQPLTAARARTAAEQERRRAAGNSAHSEAAESKPPTANPSPRAAAAGAPPASPDEPRAASAARAAAASTSQATPPPAAASAQRASAQAPSAQATFRPEAQTRGASTTAGSTAQQSRSRIVQRALPQTWPSVGQRLTYGLIAWLPFAAAIILASSVRIDEVMQGALMALMLGVLVSVPRLAYVLAVATLGLLVVAAVLIGALAVLGVRLPLSNGFVAAIGGALALGYVATAGMVALGPPGLRPWTRGSHQATTR